jgi:DNA-binding winged helix-turn-helix (wHTH) protein
MLKPTGAGVGPLGVAELPASCCSSHREVLKKRLMRIGRQLARVERVFGVVLEDLALLGDDLDAGLFEDGHRRWTAHRRRPRGLHPGLCATEVLTRSCQVTLVVGGLAQEVVLTPLQVDLVNLLRAPTKVSPDHLVGFKTLAQLVHGLRSHHGRVSGRSATVAVSRLRQALGPTYGGLIETARRSGYRLRVLVCAPSRSSVPAAR